MNKIRIATMVSAHFTIPSPKGIVYAPMDIAKWVAEELVARGHMVDLFAPEGSSLKVSKIVSLGLKALKQNDAILKYPKVGNAEMNKIFNLWDQFLVAEIEGDGERRLRPSPYSSDRQSYAYRAFASESARCI